jgi:hypothetical protein
MLVTQLISLKGNYLFPNRTIRSKQYLCKSLIGLLDGVRLCLALSRFAHNRGIRFMRADGILTSSPSPPWTLNLQAPSHPTVRRGSSFVGGTGGRCRTCRCLCPVHSSPYERPNRLLILVS